MRCSIRAIAARLQFYAMRLYVPAGMRRRELEELFCRTAAAFGRTVPPAQGRSAASRLREFAGASRDWAEAALTDGSDLAGIDNRLYRSALHLGRIYRARLGIASRADGLAAARSIYRLLGIDLKADSRTGDIVVRRCMFSSRYSAGACGVISALDRGLFAGLCGGGELAFSARITEGCAVCRARLCESGQPVRRAIVVGSGAGGAAAARELQAAYQVTVLEAGGNFRPLS
ncbi:MAG: hypothetical protein Q8M76_07835, partial [Spirochaetaceae bacterium]|nr:hypothetical protein [Spirochaetaceae bacterium]